MCFEWLSLEIQVRGSTRVLIPEHHHTPNITISALTHYFPPESPTRIMSFGVGVGDIVLVSNGAIKFWTTINNAPSEQADLAKALELLRGVVQRITDCGSTLAPKLGPATARVLQQQLSLCSKHLGNLDDIVIKYMGHSSDAAPDTKRQRRRLFLWGMYKRDEFVQSLEELRKVVVLLLSYVTFENTVPASPNSASNREPLHLIDALDRETVCSISMCDTWEVCYSRQQAAFMC